MRANNKGKKIVVLAELAFERDKKKLAVELTDYYVDKSRQIKGAQLVSAILRCSREKLISMSEARKLTGFLARTFDIRAPAIQSVHAGFLGQVVSVVNTDSKVVKKISCRRKITPGKDFFQQLFLRLQLAVQENILDYNGARLLVKEIVRNYPTTKNCLHR